MSKKVAAKSDSRSGSLAGSTKQDTTRQKPNDKREPTSVTTTRQASSNTVGAAAKRKSTPKTELTSSPEAITIVESVLESSPAGETEATGSFVPQTGDPSSDTDTAREDETTPDAESVATIEVTMLPEGDSGTEPVNPNVGSGLDEINPESAENEHASESPAPDKVLFADEAPLTQALVEPSAPPPHAAPLDTVARKAERQRLENERKEQVAKNRERAKAERAAVMAAQQQEKPSKRDLGERYNRAAEAVSRTHREFLAALDAKAKILGVERVNEAVTASNSEIEALDSEIRNARTNLETLLKRRREFKMASPELREVQERISRARKARNLARAEKKAALAEATAI